MNRYCPGCSRPTDRCVCDLFSPEEPRASRAPEGHVTMDAATIAALTHVPEEAIREKDE